MKILKPLLVAILALIAMPNARKLQTAEPPVPLRPSVIVPGHSVSPALRDIPALPSDKAPVFRKILRHSLPRKAGRNPRFVDPVLQDLAGPPSIPSPSSSFEGLSNDSQAGVSGVLVLPPDPIHAVGPNHIVQAVNLAFAVWDKMGNLVAGPYPGNALWAGTGGACANTNNGDPIVLYDHLTDRWLISEFALPNLPFGPYYQCIAISTTGDPTGAYHLYQVPVSNTKLNDYPKIGVWPDGYYIAFNQFKFTCLDIFCFFGFWEYAGQGVMACEREKMLNGDPAVCVGFDLFSVDPNLGGMLPADLDGTPPPSGSPGYYVQVDDDASGYSPDQLQIWRFNVNWANPSASTFTGPTALPTAFFDSNLCAYSRNCIPQPGGTQVDAISDRLMYRLQYRNFGTHESMVVNHTVDVNGADHAGIRWYELRKSGGSGWSIYQQGTYAPDGDHRWMGSMAMDKDGNIALGYSVSSSVTFPSVRYTGRLSGDSLGTLPQGENEIIAGAGYQRHSSGRWGDYSLMAVDPTDDCTFWYTQEYYASASDAGWQTRIGSFSFPSCGAATPLPTVTISATGDASEAGPTPGTFEVTRTGSTAGSLVVKYRVNGTATAGTDYTSLSGSVTIPVGSSTAAITVNPVDDADVESNETVILTLSTDPAYNVGTPDSATVLIMDNDAPPADSITVVSPNGGEKWNVGTDQTISWTSSGVSGNVKIELSRDGGSSWETIFSGTANDGSEIWTVSGPKAKKAQIRVCGTTNSSICDTSDGNFSIVGAAGKGRK